MAAPQGVPFVRALVVYGGVFFRYPYVYVVEVGERADECLEVDDAVR